jgi:hypothetical protein
MTIAVVPIVVTLLVIALLFWVLQQIGLPEPIRKIIYIVAVVLVCLWLLSLVSGWSGGPVIHLGR